MVEEDDEIWMTYATLSKVPISKIPEIRKYLKSIGHFVIDKHSIYDIKLVEEKPTPSDSTDGVDNDK